MDQFAIRSARHPSTQPPVWTLGATHLSMHKPPPWADGTYAVRFFVATMQVMGKHSGFQRAPDDFKPGKLIAWEANGPTRQSLARRVRYSGNGAHKTYTSPNGEWTPCWRRGKASCWKFDQNDWPRLVDLLRRAIVAGCVAEFQNDFPSRVWAYINDTLHEARLHNAQLGEYHGFPLEFPEQFPIDSNNILRNAPREQIAIH